MSHRSYRYMVHGVAILLINLPVHVAARDALTDSADVGIPTVRNEAENSIAVSPLDSRVLFVSNIANVTAGVTSWFSLDAGKSWLTSDSLVLAPSFADPAVAIGRTGGTYGRFFVNHLDSNVDYELGIHYKSATGGTSWTHVEISDGKASGPGTDKNHLAVNNNTSGSFQNYIVTAWHDLLASSSGVYAAFSTDNGASWSDPQAISANSNGYQKRNVNLAWGRPDSSKVFACWTRAPVPGEVHRLFFAASIDGGDNWLPTGGSEIATISGFSTLTGKSAQSWGTGGYPSMAIDKNTGDIYIAYATKPSSHSDVQVIKSTDNGYTWEDPVVVHDSSSRDQWHQWIAWDDCTGALAVVYFDSRNFANNDSVRTYVSVSFDGADTWTDFQVSDGAGWDGDDGFAGHYIGIAAKDGIAFPIWSDDRVTNTVFKPYISPIYLWGVTQSSIAHSAVSAPELELTVTVEWDTSMPATGTDYLVLTSPTNVVYTATATPSSPGTSHEVEKLCPCEAGDWSYIVKSTRPGFTPRGSNPKTLRITACVD